MSPAAVAIAVGCVVLAIVWLEARAARRVRRIEGAVARIEDTAARLARAIEKTDYQATEKMSRSQIEKVGR